MPEIHYPHILAEFHAGAWAVLPAKLLEIRAFLWAKMRGEKPPLWSTADAARQKDRRAQLRALEDWGEDMPREPPVAGPLERAGGARVGKAAVLPLYGTIVQRASLVTDISGATSTETIGRALDALAADPTCRAIVLDVDSPGGSVFGVSELWAKIQSVAGEKKVVAVANSMAASAAYWLASAAREIYVTPGGQVGSIGVLSAHEDLSAAYEQEGVKTTLVSAGKYKTEGNPYGPLDEEGRASMQRMVDEYYQSFAAAVARGRGISEARVKADYGQGRLVSAKDAKAAGMVDGIATLEQVLGRLGATASPGGASAEVLRRKLDVAEED